VPTAVSALRAPTDTAVLVVVSADSDGDRRAAEIAALDAGVDDALASTRVEVAGVGRTSRALLVLVRTAEAEQAFRSF